MPMSDGEQGEGDPMAKVMELIKKLEADGMSPADAKAKGMAMVMEMTQGGDPSASENPDMGEDKAGTSQDDMPGGNNTDQPGDIKTMMAIAKAKKAMPGMKPSMGGAVLN